MSNKSKCVKCDRTDTSIWSVSGGGSAVVADLCPDHAAYLMELVGSTKLQKPPARNTPQRIIVPRTVQMRPLDWTPPN